MKTEIELNRVESDMIGDFWNKHGRRGASMIAQPLRYGGKYTLKIKMLSPSDAIEVSKLFQKLGIAE